MRIVFAMIVALTSCNAFAASASTEVEIPGLEGKTRFYYELLPIKSGYKTRLKVNTQDGASLLQEEWLMKKSDLNQLIEEEGRASVKDWTDRFFSNKPFNCETFSTRKLGKDDLSAEYIAFSAERLKVTTTELEQTILNQKTSFVFTYRTTWREDLVVLTYVSKFKQFVSISGYGE